MMERASPHVVSIAWYEEDDDLCLSGCDGGGQAASVPPAYPAWRTEATSGVFALLAAGRAVDLVTVRAGAYHRWLGPRPDTRQARSHDMASCSAGSQAPRCGGSA